MNDDADVQGRFSEATISTHTTHEDTDEEEDLWQLPVPRSMVGSDILENYFKAVKKIKYNIEAWESMDRFEMYNLQPVLIADRVPSSILDELPSLVSGYHVKSVVRNHKLYITNLSNGTAHGIGVSHLNYQAGAWNRSLLFTTLTDATLHTNNGADGSSPDLVISIVPQHRAPGDLSGRLVIIELEVSNRGIKEMRTDFLPYFEEPTVYAVVGIKLLTTNRQRLYPTQRALAVQWTRGPDGIFTERVCDFGLVSISHSARALFAHNVVNSMPPVPPGMWAENRHVPVPLAALPPHYEGPYLAAAAQYIQTLFATTALQHLYSGTSPTFVFSGATLQSFLHNIPPGIELSIEDFVLDLGSLLYRVQQVAHSQA